MNQHYPFQLTPLPYPYDALVPHIGTETLHLHHDKHLQTYVNKLNEALQPYPAYHRWSLRRLCSKYTSLPSSICTEVRHNAGGVFNHELYFACMCRGGKPPQGKLETQIDRCFGSYSRFCEKIKLAASNQFGSGYAFLVLNQYNKLSIVTTANQDTPLPRGLRPILNVDVWEHAYYLDYHNLRADYLDNWINVIDWSEVEKNYLREL